MIIIDHLEDVESNTLLISLEIDNKEWLDAMDRLSNTGIELFAGNQILNAIYEYATAYIGDQHVQEES